MSLTATLSIMALASLVLIVSLIASRRPYKPGRMIPWPHGLIQFVALLVILIMAGHLVSLLTGQPLLPRRGY